MLILVRHGESVWNAEQRYQGPIRLMAAHAAGLPVSAHVGLASPEHCSHTVIDLGRHRRLLQYNVPCDETNINVHVLAFRPDGRAPWVVGTITEQGDMGEHSTHHR